MPKPNYQRDKRQRDLARQHKQEEKRQKKALKQANGGFSEETEASSTFEPSEENAEPTTGEPTDQSNNQN